MGPRANFACAKCGVTHEDLPVESTRCPVTGFRRGFKRLFDAVNVSGSQQRAGARIVDTVVTPEYDRQMQIKSAAIQAAAPTRQLPPEVVLAQARQSGPNAAYSLPVLRGLRGIGGPRAFGRDH